jgi:chemotaxis-related protein WspD
MSNSQNNGQSLGTVAERSLLDREIPFDYLTEWTQALAEQTHSLSTTLQQDSLKIGSTKETLSIMIFRLGDECFALPVSMLQEITRSCPVHTLPHRSNDLFLGLVNIRGEVILCVSLANLLSVEMPIDPTYSRIDLKRMIVVERQASRWVFPVDEVHRVYRFHPNEVQEAPVVVTQAKKAYTQGIIDWQHKKVNYLDADRLFDTLDRLL